jgi:hypothetical protein
MSNEFGNGTNSTKKKEKRGNVKQEEIKGR